MVLQDKAWQDIKAIDLMASPNPTSPAGDTDSEAEASKNGSGPLAQHSLLTPSLASFP